MRVYISHLLKKTTVLKFQVSLAENIGYLALLCCPWIVIEVSLTVLQLNWSVFLDKCVTFLRLREVTTNFAYKVHVDKFHCLG